MKKLFFLFVLPLLVNVLYAQEQSQPELEPLRRGYIGIGVGPAFLTKSYDNASSGIQANLNFGYLISESVGINASVLGTSFDLSNYTDQSIGLSGFLVGPLFSTAYAADKFQFDLRPTVGYVKGSVSVGNKSGTTKEGSFAAGAGASVRWNTWRLFSLSANLDYYYGKINDVDLSSIGVTIGVSYRLK
ncbi:outer membrane beta-barrel protein [Parabacteroides sp. PF5-9]|uniref:outer membrane beta-barrel protein n=1 Tax=Parabacteroides sp. PF5-9 TaxID=1742404 RepID=UPI0024745AA0|nr:outer membrane beta-barrel protein [Parabacteroides sp. PF5-9]MDH6357970.1 hypothetical protein [Parabacteroides sp. PF5-9]